MQSCSQYWQFNPACNLHWQHWGEDYILYNAASGETHLINELGAYTLQLLQEGPLSVAELGERVAAHYDLTLDAELHSYITTVLASMDGLGLIEPHEIC